MQQIYGQVTEASDQGSPFMVVSGRHVHIPSRTSELPKVGSCVSAFILPCGYEGTEFRATMIKIED